MNLKPFLNPQSVAIVGAGDRPTSSGGAVLANLRRSGFRGAIYPVNPKGGEIQGLPAYASLRGLPSPAELVAILVRPDAILDVVREAADTGHRHLLILPGGFAEAGEAGRNRDRELRQLAQEHRLLIGGPNCAGNINLLDKVSPFAVTFFRDMPRGGGVAFVSQSGAIIEEAIAASHSLNMALGAVVSVGNSFDLSVTEYLAEFGRDPRCSAVLVYLESFGDSAHFAQAAREVTRNKPVVALIGGRTGAGREAALRHTGSRAADDDTVEAFCRQAGMVRVKSLRRLMLAGKAFGAFPQGIGRRVLLLSNSGGPGVLAADQASDEGLLLPELPPVMSHKLRNQLPPEASVANPMDLLADAREDRFALTLTVALDHASAFDAILMIHVVPFMVDAAPVIAELARLSKAAPVPILHSMMGTLENKAAWFDHMEAAGVPVFNDSEEMCIAASLLARHRQLNGHAERNKGER
jgi:acetyltransferase